MNILGNLGLALLLSLASLQAAELVSQTNTPNGGLMTSVAAPPVQPPPIIPPPTVITNGVLYPDAHLHEGIVSRQIEPTESGCEATYGRHKISFNTDIASSQPPITVTMPNGSKVAFRPTFIVLANRLTGENLLIAEVTNRTGEIIQPNIVLWTNAFDSSGPMIDIEYRYSFEGLEQNVIFRQNPLKNMPQNWNIADISVECWTEAFFDLAPSIQSQTAQLRPTSAGAATVEVEDQNIVWESMKVVARGRAFSIGSEEDTSPVSKVLTQIDDNGRTQTFLIETLDALSMKAKFDALPVIRHASATRPNSSRSELLRYHASNQHKKSSEQALVSPRDAKATKQATSGAPDTRLVVMRSKPSSPGVILDFTIINTVPVPSGIVSWWPAGGNALDAEANHNDGTLNGSTSYAAGKVGQTFNFTGSSGYVQIADSASLNPTNALTIDAWVYFNSGTSNHMIVGKDNQGTQRQFLLSVSSNAKFRSYVGITNGTFYYAEGNTVVTQGAWYHVAMTYSAANSNLALYVNGTLDTNVTVSGSTIRSTEPVFIGNQPYGISYASSFLVDEADLFNRALSGSEIQSIYNAGAAGKVNPNCVSTSTNAVGWWAGDDNIYDLAHTNFGVLFNGASYAAGKVSDGFSFDGVNDYLVVSNNATAGDLNPTNAITLEAWVYLNSFDNAHHPIISKDGCTFDRQYLLTVNNLQTFRFHIGTSCGFCYADGTNVVPVGAWTHVAMTYDSATQKLILYVNGVKDKEVSSITGPIISTTQPVFIGGAPHSCFPYYFPGIIDESTIYNRALTATEISAIYSAGCAGKCKVDLDADGLTDLQEAWVGTNPLNSDTDGDGRSDGDEVFVYHSNPMDYYNGTLPTVTILRGNNQCGMPGVLLPLPLSVVVSSASGAPLFNAPITFAASGTSLTGSTNAHSDVNGIASIYAAAPSSTATVTATASSGAGNVQVSFSASNVTGITLWLKADAGTYYASNAMIWLDQSGNSYHASEYFTNRWPITNIAGGIQVLSFTPFQSMALTNFPSTNFTQAEIFAFLRTATNMPANNAPFGFGASGRVLFYPSLDDFGSGNAFSTGVPAQRWDVFHLYNVLSKTNEWTCRINGKLYFTSGNSSVAFAGVPYIGRDGVGFNYFSGDIAEILMFNRTLTQTERDGIGFYFNTARYGWVSSPPAPAGLFATAISPNQVSLVWTNAQAGNALIYLIERKIAGGCYSQIGVVRDGNTFVDTNAFVSATNTYRIVTANYTGLSPYSSEITVVTPGTGTSLPLSTLRMWLKADSGIVFNTTNNIVSFWLDQSGWTNDAAVDRPSDPTRYEPAFVDSALNGRPIVRFDGDSHFFFLPNFPTNMPSAEAFAVLKANASGGLWTFGSGGPCGYPDVYGGISENFGRTDFTQFGVPLQHFDQYHLYDVYTTAWIWTNRLNGRFYGGTENTNPVFQSRPALSYNYAGSYFRGDMAEILLFSKVLTREEREAVGAYLNSKYAFLTNTAPVPGGVAATGVVPSQIKVAWTNAEVTNGLTYTVERKTGTNGVYAPLFVLTDTNSYIDPSAYPGTNFGYRIKSWNFAGYSGYSSEVLTPAAVITNPLPQAVFSTGTNIVVGAIAIPGTGSVSKVEFYVNDKLYATVTNAPYATTITNLTFGAATVSARAVDTLGNSAFSAYTPLVVSPDTDGDGFSDYTEILLGTDPNNPLDYPHTPPGDPSDHTPPTIYLDEPGNATLLP